MAAGDYIRSTWQNGPGVGHPPINEDNLNNIEEKLEELDGLLANDYLNYRFNDLKKYFWMRNCKEICLFDDYTDWTGVGCNVGPPSSSLTGNSGTSFVDADALAGTIYIHDTRPSVDLSKFNDEEASSTDDIISLSIHLFNYTKLTNITIKLGDDNANNYSYTWNVTEGYQVTFQAKKSAFATNGAPTGWNDITYVHIQSVTIAGASTAYITPLALMMYRNDPVLDGQGQPFQKYSGSAWSNFFTQQNNAWNLLFDPVINDLGIQCLNDYNDSSIWNGLKVKSNVVSFAWKSIFHVYYAAYTNIMTWYNDTNNYAIAFIDNDNFTLTVNEAGVPATYTFLLNTSLYRGERLEITLEKNVSTIRSTLVKGNDRIAILEHETTISSSALGDLYFGFDTVGVSFIPDFIISNINNLDLGSWDKPKIIIKRADESTSNDDTLSEDSELYIYLTPNSMFEIDLLLKYYTNASTTPDVKVDWLATGDIEAVTQRSCFGYAVATATMFSASFKYYAMDLDQEMPYGGGEQANKYSFAKENFIVKTGVNGGLLQLRWAQNTSNANETTVKAESYIKATKIDLLQDNK
jgi:hypothetical protein